MIGRGRREAERSRGLRWFAASAGLAIAGATVLAMGPAHADSSPTPSYHAGNDQATFTATGVLDSNCLVSTGGTEVWIKPGDSITFDSALAGIDLSALHLNIGKVVGLNVSGLIDGKTPVAVTAGGTTQVQSSKLSAGDHKLDWTVNSITLVPVIQLPVIGSVLGKLTTIPLSVTALKAGASLSWSGIVHVTDSAPTCKLAVGTPKTQITLGPVKVTVPPVNVGVPVPTLPNIGSLLPSLPGTGKTTGTNPGQAGNPGGSTYTPPGLTIPQEVVPSGDGNGPGTVDNSGFGNALPDLGNGLGSAPSAVTSTAPNGAITTLDPANTQQKAKTVQLAANPSPSAQMPVLLAIIAIIALSLVTATYARLYLLRKPPTA